MSATPAVIHKILFQPLTPIPPGEQIGSAEIDVSGAQHVTVNVGIEGAVANVEREIVFIHRGVGTAVVSVQTDTFSPDKRDPDHAFLSTLVPVYAPILHVVLTNNGSEPARTFNSWVYGVRIAT